MVLQIVMIELMVLDHVINLVNPGTVLHKGKVRPRVVVKIKDSMVVRGITLGSMVIIREAKKKLKGKVILEAPDIMDNQVIWNKVKVEVHVMAWVLTQQEVLDVLMSVGNNLPDITRPLRGNIVLKLIW